MNNCSIVFLIFFGLNGFSQNFIASNSEVSTSNHYIEINSPKTTSIDKLYFESNSSDLNEASILSLKTVIMIMKDNPKMNISIKSFIDINEKQTMLSANRAFKVKKYLVKKGIISDRLNVKYLGNTIPTNQGDLNKLERRVEFIID